MIIKGKSRTNGRQLAAYLQKLDGNERVQILEHKSRHDSLSDTFMDWEVLAEGVEGKKYLYHAQINPEARYGMTPEQWTRAADVTEKELRLVGQPRVIVLHEQDDGRVHAHLVWHRIDLEKMTLIADGWNYLANERASLALEQEFGHELVPGKHAKRDRVKQPEFPRAEMTEDEYQQAKRTGIDPQERKTEIAALKAASENAQSFENALEEAGYILAKGDRGYLILDENGDHSTLARQLKIKTKDVNAYMAEVPLDTLPSLEQAKEIQRELAKNRALAKPPQETPVQEEEVKGPEQAAKTTPETPKPDQEHLAELEAALKKRHEEERRKMEERQEIEISRINESYDRELLEKLSDRRAMQQAELDAFLRMEEFSDNWMKRFAQVIKYAWNPAAAERDRLEREQQIQAIKDRHRIARETMTQTLKLQRDEEINDRKELHFQQHREHAGEYQDELARRSHEHEAGQRLLAEIAEQQRLEDIRQKEHGPEPPKPSL